MDNIVLTSSSQTSPNTGNPLNPQPIPPLASEPATTSTIESIVSTPLEPISTKIESTGQTNIDENVQAHDIALSSAKTNGHQQNNDLKTSENHKIDIDDNDKHPDKSKSCCSMLNKLFLALAIVCFALFLCSIAYIVANFEGVSLHSIYISLLFV
jgi:CHASE3 domain sensor protein